MLKRWDIFCAVVDNYGDVGVCWRLARQLTGEHGLTVRLWVDDLAALRRICPGIDPERGIQLQCGVEVRRAQGVGEGAADPADVVIEAFGCALPHGYVSAMARRAAKPRWINLEYLSAEDWVVGCHGLASPSPSLPLTKHFFFPGFVAGTGGLLMERGLDDMRREFQQDPRALAVFWQSLGLAPALGDEARVSLFCYPAADVPALFEAWCHQASPVTCLVPEGIGGEALAAFLGNAGTRPGSRATRGSLTVCIVPFLPQECYDRLLWACDANFVRGEDSFVRAQWAQRPFVWQPYAQADGAHLRKLDAFLQQFGNGLPAEAQVALDTLWRAWTCGGDLRAAWPAFWAQRSRWAAHAEEWAGRLRAQGDLAANLLRFCSDSV